MAAENPHGLIATKREFRAVLDSLAAIPSIAGGKDETPDPWLSVALWGSRASPMNHFRVDLGESPSRRAYRALLGIFQANREFTRALHEWGCDFDLLPHDTPQSEEGRALVDATAFRPLPAADREYVGSVRVTNTSQRAFPAPLSLVVVRKGNCQLINPDGRTCNIRPPGSWYVNLKVGNGLAPGASVARELHF